MMSQRQISLHRDNTVVLHGIVPDFLLDWAYYKPILVSSLFYPLHFGCMLSLSIQFFFLQLLCTNMKKAAVQPSLQYKQLETKDSIKKQFLV